MNDKVGKFARLVGAMGITIGGIELVLVGGTALLFSLIMLISPNWNTLLTPAGFQESLISFLPFAARLPLAVIAIVTGVLIRTGSKVWVKGALAIGVLVGAQFCFDTIAFRGGCDDLLATAIFADRILFSSLLIGLTTVYYQTRASQESNPSSLAPALPSAAR